MLTEYVYSIGVMSGTSLDGIDLAYVKFNNHNYTDFSIITAETIPYSTTWKQTLQKAITTSKNEVDKTDITYAELTAKVVTDFIKKHNIQTVDFIASHGHTVFHQPEKGITVQIGNGQVLANRTNTKVICNFRVQDVALGGQGAPLVPIGDKWLFPKYDYCLNLGGFANISFENKDKRIAFDICPVNIVLNYYTEKLGFAFDNKGEIAASGKINHQLLTALNTLDFYKKTAPKSLGLEWVKSVIFPLIDSLETDIPTILRTFVEHIAIQISSVCNKQSSILITGGGAFNSFLIHRLSDLLTTKITLPNNVIINYKEALIFAFLGVLRNKNEINCLQSVTGAKKNHSSGYIYLPK